MRLRSLFILTGILVFLATSPGISDDKKADDNDRARRRTPVVEVVEKVNPTVVNISTERLIRPRIMLFDPFFDEEFERFFGSHKTRSLGSGIIIDPDGYILTNAHVVLRASTITVTLIDKSEYKAILLATSLKNDLALIKIDPKPDANLKAIEFGTSSDLMSGETVIALGNPFGLSNTVTVGVISASNRSVMLNERVVFKDFLQTDAAINPGNSGGPLVNILGKLIGINTAIKSKSTAEGIGFAIPVDRACHELTCLVDQAPLSNLYTGISLLKGKHDYIVKEVLAESPAEKAGVKSGDIITSVGGKKFLSAVSLAKAVAARKADDELEIVIKRDDETRKLTLILAERPESQAQKLARKHIGLNVGSITYGEARKSGLSRLGGVFVREVITDGPGARIGFEKDDCITEMAIIEQRGMYSVRLNSTEIRSLEDLEEFLTSRIKGRLVAVTIDRNGEKLTGKLVAR
ncbi:MAG: trypsin-like peptidase domain-containing protein [Planctomycetota bacterium]|jgi:serine protease Do